MHVKLKINTISQDICHLTYNFPLMHFLAFFSTGWWGRWSNNCSRLLFLHYDVSKNVFYLEISGVTFFFSSGFVVWIFYFTFGHKLFWKLLFQFSWLWFSHTQKDIQMSLHFWIWTGITFPCITLCKLVLCYSPLSAFKQLHIIQTQEVLK